MGVNEIALLFSAIAGIGVCVQLLVTWFRRPRVEIETQPPTDTGVGMTLVIRNIGNSAAIGFQVFPTECSLVEGLGQNFDQRLEAGEVRYFIFDDLQEFSRVLFIWNHPWRNSLSCRTWMPLSTEGPLIRELALQKLRSPIADRWKKLKLRGYVGPNGSATGTTPRRDKQKRRKLSRQHRRLVKLGLDRLKES